MQYNENVWSDGVLPILRAKEDSLAEFISAKEKSLKKAPDGRLRLSKRKNQVQWFRVSKDTSAHGEYIPVKKESLARKLAQKEYDIKLLPKLKKQLSILNDFNRHCGVAALDKLYFDMHPGRRALVNPVRLPDNEYVEHWRSISYVGKSFEIEATELRTLRGEKVRSKSEVIIADTLHHLGIPYKYECPLNIKVPKGGTFSQVKIYPDFTCLNVHLRKEILWEHFGMMDDADYSKNAMKKLDWYESNGLYLGDNLIVSMESRENPRDATKVERLARHYLLKH